MEPIKHPHCNDVLRKPDGMTEEECRDLHICRASGCVWSFWKPNAEELAALVVGGSVALSIMGETHPPLSIHAALPTEPFNGALTVEELIALSRTMRERNHALMGITKRIVSAWVRSSPDSPERRRLVDEFLDLSTLNHGLNEVVRAVPVVEPEQTTTATDAERYKTDAMGYRADAEQWKGEAERWRKMAENAAMMTDGQRTFDAGGWMNECLNAEQELAKARDAIRLLSTTVQELDAVMNSNHPN